MSVYETKLTPDNIIKLPRHLKYFQNEVWTLDYKISIKRLFRIKIKSKKRILGNNYIEVIKYDKSIYKYDKSIIYDELKKIVVGHKNWYNDLSSQAKYFIRQVDNMLFNQLYNAVYNYDNYKNIDDRYKRLYNYALEHQKYEMLDKDLQSLKADVFQNNIILGNNTSSYYEKYKRILDYAINNDDNLLNDSKTDLSDDTILLYILLDEPIPTTNNDKIRRSCSRTYQSIIDYARANEKYFKYFVTLTFADLKEKEMHIYYNNTKDENEYNLIFEYINNPSDYNECIEKFNKFRNNLNKQLKKAGVNLYYLGVPEYHENGNIHYHLLMGDIPEKLIYEIPGWLDFDYKHNKRRLGKGIKLWKHGKSDIEIIKDKNRVVNYLAGYIVKSIRNLDESEYLERLNKKRFYKSQNLIKPEIKINEDYQKEYEDIYYTEYQNAFNQSQTQKILFTI